MSTEAEAWLATLSGIDPKSLRRRAHSSDAPITIRSCFPVLLMIARAISVLMITFISADIPVRPLFPDSHRIRRTLRFLGWILLQFL